MSQNPVPSPSEHTFLVTISRCDREQAEQVIAERINYDEDYGFDYTIIHHDHRPSSSHTSSAITLDAESVKAEVQDRFTNSQNHGLSADDLTLVLAADDEHISQLINNLVDDSFWAEYDDVRSRVIDQLLSEGS